jgi:3-oxoacyl-[acyl-carrier protein] reductase
MDKVALVTGASGDGIGRSTALTLARDGFHVVVNYLTNKAQAELVCSQINGNGGKSIAVGGDIFVQKECDLLVNETIMNFSRIDVCIIGPGADWNAEPPDKIAPSKSLNDVIQEISPIYSFLPRVIPEMRKAGSGRIIGIASNPRLPSPSYSYNVAKHSRIAALMELAAPCWKNRITVNVIAPGPIDHISTMEEAVSQSTTFPAKAKVSPQDVAEIIAYLCSDKGRYITGNVVTLNF